MLRQRLIASIINTIYLYFDHLYYLSHFLESMTTCQTIYLHFFLHAHEIEEPTGIKPQFRSVVLTLIFYKFI